MTLAADWATLDWRLAVAVVALGVSGAALFLPYWRRPNLSIRTDSERTHSRVEGNQVPHVRVLAKNKKRKRSAKQARVVLDGYRVRDSKDPLTSLSSPFLGWPSTFGQPSGSYVSVIFAGAERPVGLGQFRRVRVDPDTDLRERETHYSQDLAVGSGPRSVTSQTLPPPQTRSGTCTLSLPITSSSPMNGTGYVLVAGEFASSSGPTMVTLIPTLSMWRGKATSPTPIRQ